VNSFLFAPEGQRRLAVIRVFLGAVLLFDALVHWRYAIELYSRSGPPMPLFVRAVADSKDAALLRDDAGVPIVPRVEPWPPVPVPSPQLAVIVHSLLVFSLASVVAGWRTRTSLVGTILLTLWLAPFDLPGTFAKHTVVALHLLVLLAFSGCGDVWSVDAFSRIHDADRCRLSSAAPRRLMQILICCVYLGAAITKIKTPAFTNGDLLTFSLLDDHWGCGPAGFWLATMPHVTLMLSLATILYEIMFPVLIWVPRMRLFTLGLATAVHTAMAGLLNLETFSPIMLAALVSFAHERDLAAVARLFGAFSVLPGMRHISGASRRALGTRASGDSGAARRAFFKRGWHFCAAVAFVSAGFVLQYCLDWYGIFGRHSLAALNEISSGDVAEMLSQRSPPYEDYFHRIEVGARVGGNQVFGPSRRFEIGQRAYVLAQLIQPHPVMELEGILIMPDGREAVRFSRRIDPTFDYAINGFELTEELPPGTYRILIQAEGFVVADRRFELLP
jgi:hypothetical protein